MKSWSRINCNILSKNREGLSKHKYKKRNHRNLTCSRIRFLNLVTIHIWGEIILYCGRLSIAGRIFRTWSLSIRCQQYAFSLDSQIKQMFPDVTKCFLEGKITSDRYYCSRMIVSDARGEKPSQSQIMGVYMLTQAFLVLEM